MLTGAAEREVVSKSSVVPCLYSDCFVSADATLFVRRCALREIARIRLPIQASLPFLAKRKDGHDQHEVNQHLEYEAPGNRHPG